MAIMAIDTKEEAKELLGLLRKAKKAASAATTGAGEGEGTAELIRCTNILTRLKSLPMSVETLVSTQAVNFLKPLKQHPNPNIRFLASHLYAIWSKKDPAASSSTRLEIKNRFFLLKTKDPKRDRIREQLHEGLSMVLGEIISTQQQQEPESSDLDPARVAVEVEEVLFRKWGKFGDDKSINAKYRSLLFNIRDPKNVDFRRRLLVGEIKAAEVGAMRTEEMGNDKRRYEAKVMSEKALLKIIIGIQKKGTTKEFKCGRCGKRDASYGQMQTRSADEPMTTFVTCMVCDYGWKFC